jgi:hypothetical protein
MINADKNEIHNCWFFCIIYSDKATKVMIDLLGTYTEDNASQARDDAHRSV